MACPPSMESRAKCDGLFLALGRPRSLPDPELRTGVRLRVLAIDDRCGGQEIEEASKADPERESDEAVPAEEFNQGRKERVGSDVRSQADETGADEPRPLGHARLRRAVSERHVPVEEPVPGHGGPEREQAGKAVLKADPLQPEIASHVDKHPRSPDQSEAQHSPNTPVPVHVESSQLAQEFNLLAPGHLARSDCPLSESDGHLPGPQPPSDHELEADLVARSPNSILRGHGGASDREESGHRIGAANERQGQDRCHARVHEAPKAPSPLHDATCGVAATDDHVAVLVQCAEEVDDPLRGVG